MYPTRLSLCKCFAMARPRIFLRPRAETGLDRISNQVPRDRPQLLVRLDAYRPVPALEEMPAAVVPSVEGTRISRMEPMHPGAQVRLLSLNQQMHVVRHQAVREAQPPSSLDGSLEQRQIDPPVVVREKDAPTIVAAREHVVDAGGEFVARTTGHTS